MLPVSESKDGVSDKRAVLRVGTAYGAHVLESLATLDVACVEECRLDVVGARDCLAHKEGFLERKELRVCDLLLKERVSALVRDGLRIRLHRLAQL